MVKSVIFTELLKHACPSIQYRVRKELLGQPAEEPAMQAFQRHIMEDAVVREVIGWQQPDGWLAYDFHGRKSTETGIRILCEKGVDPRSPVLTRAYKALADYPERLERGFGKPGRLLDEAGLGGQQMALAVLFAYASIENQPFIKPQIETALACFESAAALRSIADLTEIYKGKRIIRAGMNWPSIYHLRLLAWADSWRSAENLSVVCQGIQRLIDLSPIPRFSLRYDSQLIAPASFGMDDFKPDLDALDNVSWMIWFHRMELLARLGVTTQIPELHSQLRKLQLLLDDNGWFRLRLCHAYFRNWGAYTGLMLESDWKDLRRRMYDLTFRTLLILHHSQRHKAATMDKLPNGQPAEANLL